MPLPFRAAKLLIALLLVFSTGCGSDFHFEPSASSSASHSSHPTTKASPAGDTDSIHIASFNIQVFGMSKMGKPHVMERIVEIVRRFDIVAIQELRAVDQTIVPQFVEMLNADGANFQSVVGPRLGRTSSKEQYVYIYDASRIELVQGSVYTVSDPDDRLHRPPLVATFRVRGPPADQAFTFKLVNIHTDPDETGTELDALADVFVNVQRDGSREDDVILLGDLNVNEYQLGRLGQLPNIRYAISGTPTNTRGTKLYDNLIFDESHTIEYLGQAGVTNFMAEFDLSLEEALEISDHFPVWAEFSAYEAGVGPLAAGPATQTR